MPESVKWGNQQVRSGANNCWHTLGPLLDQPWGRFPYEGGLAGDLRDSTGGTLDSFGPAFRRGILPEPARGRMILGGVGGGSGWPGWLGWPGWPGWPGLAGLAGGQAWLEPG
jgi:hypothetical protein